MTTVQEWVKPYNMPVSASLTLTEGLLLIKDSGNTLTLYTTVAANPVAVVDKDWKNPEGTAKTTVSGDLAGVFPIGCGAIVMVAIASGETLTTGLAIYGGQTADTDGYASNDSSNSAVKIGHYVGTGVSSTAAGQLVPVILDVAQGA